MDPDDIFGASELGAFGGIVDVGTNFVTGFLDLFGKKGTVLYRFDIGLVCSSIVTFGWYRCHFLLVLLSNQ